MFELLLERPQVELVGLIQQGCLGLCHRLLLRPIAGPTDANHHARVAGLEVKKWQMHP